MTDPREITVFVPGTTYAVPRYLIDDEGIHDNGTERIMFVKGNKNDPETFRQDGIMTESLLMVCKDYLESVNVGDLKTDYTTNAIAGIQTALDQIKARADDRKARNVQQTYQK